MKALVLEKYNKLVYREFPKPEIQPHKVLVQVKACGICGSDVHGMDGSSGRRIPPIIMGHEAAGIIAELGDEVTHWQIGDRVTFDSTIYPLEDWYTRKGLYNLSDNRVVLGVSCNDYLCHGAFADFVSVPQHILYHIPENVTFNQAALVEPAAVAAHAVNITPISFGDTSVVVGAGMIGLFIIQILKAFGSSQIIAIDLEQEKLDLAKQLGADVCYQANECDLPAEIMKITNNRGVDIGFEAVGVSQSVQTAVASVRKGATVTIVGNLTQTIQLPLQSIVTKQIRLQGSCAICGEYPSVLSMIETGRINVDALISATAPLADGAIWFQRLYKREKGLMKIVLNP